MDCERIVDIAFEVGLGDVAKELSALALSGFRLIEVGDDQPVGPNQMGGRPRLPNGTQWPVVDDGRPGAGTPMCFVAQIELADVPDRLIPGNGLLTIWCDGDEPFGPGAARAILSASDPNLSEYPWPADLPAESQRRGQIVELAPELTLPGFGVYPALALESLGFGVFRDGDDIREDAYSRLLQRLEQEQFPEAFDGDALASPSWAEWTPRSSAAIPVVDDWVRGPSHRLGGHANQIQGDPMLDCVVSYLGREGGPEDYNQHARELARTWRLLMQDNHEYGDGGSLYFGLPADDLASGRFDRLQVVMQCC